MDFWADGAFLIFYISTFSTKSPKFLEFHNISCIFQRILMKNAKCMLNKQRIYAILHEKW